MTETAARIILGVDPGIARMGYGVIEAAGQHLRVHTYGCIETPAHTAVEQRLQTLFHQLTEVITGYRPQVMAVEELFFNRNTTTAFVVGQARGVALLAAVEAGVAVTEFTPIQVKQAVTGYGRAEKRQIQEMVRVLLGLQSIPKPDDAADALALAIAQAHVSPLYEKTGWIRGR